MKNIAYFECPTGIAGDMCLGALINAGVPLDYLKEKLSLLGIDQEYQLHAENIQQNGQQATKAHIDLINSEHHNHNHHHHHHHRDRKDNTHTHSRYLPEIEFLIKSASLPPRAENWSLAIFRQLAQAEAAVHGIPPEKVHFHEVGATDAIVDIVGTCLGLDWLDIEKIYCSPLPTGGGTVKAAHGILSVPVPAVLKLWEFREVPVYSNGIQKELCTPTGTAIAVTLADSFCAHPAMSIDRIGLGAGSAHLPIPNILRLWIGKETNHNPDNLSSPNFETISVLETQIDDLSPQGIGYIFDSLFAVGALDVFTQAITMKKSRLGILLTVICHPENKNNCENVLFRETSTLGIRHSLQQRTILAREFQTIKTDFGDVRVKIAYKAGKIINVQPEYEDCAQIARENNLSWREVHRMVLQKWYGGNRSV